MKKRIYLNSTKCKWLRVAILMYCALCLMHSATMSAQSAPWTLRQCCEYAVSNNLQIKQRENERIKHQLQLSTARNARLPDLDADINENVSFGRGLTSDNTYSNTNTSSTSFSLNSNIALFTGFQIPNTIQLNKLNLEAATQDLEKAKNDIRTQVAQAYVQILYDIEIAEVANRQVAIDSQQVHRLQVMYDNGKASPAELSQQQATLAQSRLTATQASKDLQLSYLALAQLLELPSPDGLTIARPELSLAPSPVGKVRGETISPDIIYSEALTFRPEVAAEQLRLQGTEKSIKIAQSALYPTLMFTAGLGTNYYHMSDFDSDAFGKQLRNNFSQYLGLNLQIPIFNRFATRNKIRSARVDQEIQQLQLENVKKTLYKEIQQVYYNAMAAEEKWRKSDQAVKAAQDAFILMEAKYENGKANITEFDDAKNKLMKAESDLVQARYEYLYQTALLDFYRGRELKF